MTKVKEGEIDNSGRGESIVEPSSSIIRNVLKKGDISREVKVTSYGIIATISFMLGTIPKENIDSKTRI